MGQKIKNILLALSVLCFALPAPKSYADKSIIVHETRGSMKQVLKQHPELKMQMMQNPDAQLAMAYRKSMLGFAQALDAMAHKAETVPQPFAKISATEMKRSLEQMDKFHKRLHDSLPDETKAQMGDMAEKMDEHLAKMKTEVNLLDKLASSDRVDSREVLNHTSRIMKDCGEMHMGMKGMAGKQDYHATDQKLLQDTKEEDAVLLQMVDDMNKGPEDKKLNSLADIVTKMVKERAAANARFDQVHKHMMMQKSEKPHGMGSQPGYESSPHHMQMDDNDNDEDEVEMEED